MWFVFSWSVNSFQGGIGKSHNDHLPVDGLDKLDRYFQEFVAAQDQSTLLIRSPEQPLLVKKYFPAGFPIHHFPKCCQLSTFFF
jgi:hypothetical protein